MTPRAVRALSLRMIIRTASLGLAGAGAGYLGLGLAVPLEAELAQQRWQRVFAQRLAHSQAVAAAAPGRQARSRRRAQVVPLPQLPTKGPVARLAVPRLAVNDIVLADDGRHAQLAEGPVMIKRGTAASPVTILAAHRDTHFLFVRDLRPGDAIVLQFATGRIERYRVVRFETVRWDRFTYPLAPARPLLALTTCFPFDGTEYGGPWRRLAWAERIGAAASP